MFTITKLHICKGCAYRKNLQEDYDYNLGHRIREDFYAKNVCISAIVGKNGSGKSSVLDMIFRVINNMGYCFFKNIVRNAADPISYIHGIYADLCFTSNGRDGCIHVRDGVVAIEHGNTKYRFVEYKTEAEIILGIPSQEFEDYADGTTLRYSEISALALNLFYTVATNYSLQSLIAQDYREEFATYNYNGKTLKSNSWLNNLFHKNDGYLMPITLNPYRDNGVINMATEEQLTTMRLAAIMIEDDGDNRFMEGYSFDDYSSLLYPTLQYKFYSITDNKTRLYYSNQEVEEHNRQDTLKQDQWVKTGDKHLRDFESIAKKPNSYAHVILESLGCPIRERMSDIQIYIRMYVVYKVLNAAEKYPSYEYFRDYVGNINYTFAEANVSQGGKDNLKRAKELAIKVKSDKTHIGLKLRQALNFIDREKNIPPEGWPSSMPYSEYCKIMGIEEKGMSIEKRMEFLPPGIFKTSLTLKNNQNNETIPLNHLSSGERQFLYLVSTIVYHALNIKSAAEDPNRTIYKNLNIVLDEVEICFHPEYQRTFVKKLVDTITRMKLNDYFDINILVTTHSPFLLSDIPLANILSLEKGESKKMDLRNTFCANVYDLLNNPFFMNQFIGDFASEKLDQIVEEVNRDEPLDVSEYANLVSRVDMIGDDFIHNLLLEKLSSRFSRLEQLKSKKRQLENALNEVQLEMEKLNS